MRDDVLLLRGLKQRGVRFFVVRVHRADGEFAQGLADAPQLFLALAVFAGQRAGGLVAARADERIAAQQLRRVAQLEFRRRGGDDDGYEPWY